MAFRQRLFLGKTRKKFARPYLPARVASKLDAIVLAVRMEAAVSSRSYEISKPCALPSAEVKCRLLLPTCEGLAADRRK